MMMKVRERWGAACAAMIVASWANDATALQTQPIDPTSGSSIADIVVVARKTAERLQTVPVAVSALSGEDLVKQQIGNIAQLKNNTPNMSIFPAIGQPGSAVVFIRGQGLTDASVGVDNAVATYINGVYAARSTGGATDLVDVQRVEVLRGPQGTLFGRNTTGGAVNVIPKEPTGDYEGQVRADYGNYNSFLARAVVNVPMAGDRLAARFVYQHNQHDGYGRDLTYDRDLNNANTEYMRASLKIAPGDGRLRTLIAADLFDFKSRGELVGFRSFTPSASLSALASACSGALASLCAPVVIGKTLADFVYPTGNPSFYNVYHNVLGTGRARSWGVSNIMDYDLTDALSLKSTTAWRGVNNYSLVDVDGTPYGINGGFNRNMGNTIRQDQFSQEIQITGTAARFQYILGGFYFVENALDQAISASLYPLSQALTVAEAHNRNASLAGYGQLIYRITDTVRLTGGLRFTEDDRRVTLRNRSISASGVATTALTGLLNDPNDPFAANLKRKFHYWSYLASADWQVTPDIFVYGKTSRSFRSGGINSRVATGGTLPVFFEPERDTDYEVGLKADLFNRRARFNIALFNSEIENVQRSVSALVGTPPRFASVLANAAQARLRGVEGEVTVVPMTGLTLGTNFGYINAKYKSFINADGADFSSSKFPYTPKWTVVLKGDLAVPSAIGEWNFHADYSWRSDFFAQAVALSAAQRVGLTADQIAVGNHTLQNLYRIDSYGLLNARVSLKLQDPSVELAIYGSNMTKAKYETRLFPGEHTPLGVTGYMPGDPRTYGVSATFNF